MITLRSMHHGQAVVLVALACAVLLQPTYAEAQNAPVPLPAGDTISVHRAVFGAKYRVAGSPDRYAVDPWIGLSIRQSFLDVLAQHPEAQAEVRRASPWLAVGFAGSVAVIGGSLVILKNAFDVSDSPSGLGQSDDDLLRDMVVYLGIPTIVGAVGQLKARSHLRRGVAMFNEAQRARPANIGGSTAMSPIIGAARDPASSRRVLLLGLSVRSW